MPNKLHLWDNLSQHGNPTCSTLVDNLVRHARKQDVVSRAGKSGLPWHGSIRIWTGDWNNQERQQSAILITLLSIFLHSSLTDCKGWWHFKGLCGRHPSASKCLSCCCDKALLVQECHGCTWQPQSDYAGCKKSMLLCADWTSSPAWNMDQWLAMSLCFWYLWKWRCNKKQSWIVSKKSVNYFLYNFHKQCYHIKTLLSTSNHGDFGDCQWASPVTVVTTIISHPQTTIQETPLHFKW